MKLTLRTILLATLPTALLIVVLAWFFSPIPIEDPYYPITTSEKVRVTCGELCQSIQKADIENKYVHIWNYCSTKFNLSINEFPNSIVQGRENTYFCRDSARCFLVEEGRCFTDGEEITPKVCLQVMCSTLMNLGGLDAEEAETRIKRILSPGICLSERKDGGIGANTWWDKYLKKLNCSDLNA